MIKFSREKVLLLYKLISLDWVCDHRIQIAMKR